MFAGRWSRSFASCAPSSNAQEYKEACVPIFFDAWIGPGLPELVNFDGEAQLLTTLHFDIVDEAELVSTLNHAPEVSGGEAGIWQWLGTGRTRHEPITRALLRIEDGRLRIETNSRERGEAVRELVAQLAGEAVKYWAAQHKDVHQAVREAMGAGERARPSLPEELREPARAAVLQSLAEHYERWDDEPIPALGNVTPRAAASDGALRGQLAGLPQASDIGAASARAARSARDKRSRPPSLTGAGFLSPRYGFADMAAKSGDTLEERDGRSGSHEEENAQKSRMMVATLDTGALIAIERKKQRSMMLLRAAREHRAQLLAITPVIAE